MKKLKFMLLLLLCLVMIASVATPAVAESGYIRGDADMDGFVSILDATMIQRKLAHFTVSSFSDQSADVDGDGVTILDATHIQRYLASFTNTYHIGEFVDTATKPTEKDYELPFVSS
jgi:hypothetical protein